MSDIEPLAFEDVCHSFAGWIVQQKRARRPSALFVVGINGTVGQGKTVFSQAVVRHLNTLLQPEDGLAVTRSLDDYYLPKAERYRPEFLARGYNPPGIPNRGPAGTHDTERLWEDILLMEQNLNSSSPAASVRGSIEFPAFDKQTDDRSTEPYRVSGKVGVFILEGWFVGTRTEVDPTQADPGLRRAVATALKTYKPIFDRLDALWVFEPPASFEDIVRQRIEQQETLNRETGKAGLTRDQIVCFLRYFYEDSWQPGLTAPTPPRDKAFFWAVTDSRHQFIKINPPCP